MHSSLAPPLENLLRGPCKFIRWYIKSERRYCSPESRNFTDVYMVARGRGGGGGGGERGTNLRFLWRSFQPCLRIFANWSQSEVEKSLLKGSIIAGRKIQNAENMCNYLRTKKNHKQTNKKQDKQDYSKMRGLSQTRLSTKNKGGITHCTLSSIKCGQHKNTQLWNETDVIYSTWRSFIVVAKSAARSCSLITLKIWINEYLMTC